MGEESITVNKNKKGGTNEHSVTKNEHQVEKSLVLGVKKKDTIYNEETNNRSKVRPGPVPATWSSSGSQGGTPFSSSSDRVQIALAAAVRSAALLAAPAAAAWEQIKWGGEGGRRGGSPMSYREERVGMGRQQESTSANTSPE